jgi:DNA-binding MarR family transcriptional regulator
MKTALDPALASQLRISVMRLARRLRQQRIDDRLTPSQVSALATLERHGTMTLGELAAHEHVQPPSMTRIVGALEEMQLVSRTANPTDGRHVLLTVTPAGAKRLAEDRRRRDAWLYQQLRTLTPGEVEVLQAATEILEKLK